MNTIASYKAGPCGIRQTHNPHQGKRNDGSTWRCDGVFITIDQIILPEQQVKEEAVEYTNQELAEKALELHAAATDGPWAWTDCGDKGGNAWFVGTFYNLQTQKTIAGGPIELDEFNEETQEFVAAAGYEERIALSDDTNARTQDANFIVFARNNICALAQAVLDGEAEVAKLKAQIAAVEKLCDDPLVMLYTSDDVIKVRHVRTALASGVSGEGKPMNKLAEALEYERGRWQRARDGYAVPDLDQAIESTNAAMATLESLPHKPGECACCDWHR